MTIKLTVPCRIGALADTQESCEIKRNKFLAIINKRFSSCDYIFHAGDIIYPSFLKKLKKIAPVLAVAGNEDGFKLQTSLSQRIDFRVGRFHFSLFHGHRPILIEAPNILVNKIRHFSGKPPILKGFYNHIVKSCPNSDCVIFGHSHVAFLEIYKHTLFLNPGAFCPPQEMYNLLPSVAILDVKNSAITASIFSINTEKVFSSKLKTKSFKTKVYKE